MSILKFCVGKKADKPYYVETMRVRLYSLEELDYFIWENSSLLDRSLLNDDLIRWVDEQCGMAKLAKQLYEISHFDGTLHSFAGAVMTAVGLHDETEIKLLQDRIKTYEGMSASERAKAQADHLFLSGRYVLAMEKYMNLVDRNTKEREMNNQERFFMGSLLHNIATCCAKLFFYEMAVDFYKQSYEVCGAEDEIKCILFCKKMALSPKRYDIYLSEHSEYARYANEVEQLFCQVGKQWSATADCIDLEAAVALKDSGKIEEFRAILQAKIDVWKKEYHSQVMN